MRRDRGRAPVIIIGMHRSGTSLITRMLEELGLFVGWRKDPNHEALFFLQLNEWLLNLIGGAWDNPGTIRFLLEHLEARALVTDYLAYSLRALRIVSYLGWVRYARYRSLFNVQIPWGWKDPRNTVTLPLWLDLFPEALVVHIYRHGVDVANSLRARHQRLLGHAKIWYRKRRLSYWIRGKRGRFTYTLRCASLDGGFSLWEDYLRLARSHVQNLGVKALEVKYEDLIDNPQTGLRSLVSFCGLDASEKTVEFVAQKARKHRSFAYREDPELRAFAKLHADRLALFGYYP